MSAVASRTAAVSATTSRSLRFREGSIRPRMLALAGMPLARPWGEQQDDACVGLSAHLVELLGIEVSKNPAPARDAPAVLLDLHLARRDHHPGALVDLVLLEPLARRQVDRDHAGLGVAAKDLRLVRLDVERRKVPGLHAWESNQRRAIRRTASPPVAAIRPSAT